MKRRTLLQISGSALMWSLLPPLPKIFGKPSTAGVAGTSHLFFSDADLPRIRANRNTPLLRDYYQECVNLNLKEQRDFLRQLPHTRNLIRDLPKAHDILWRNSVVYLMEDDPQRAAILVEAIEAMLKLADWDYFLEGGKETIGLQRAPGSVIALLFAREVLGDHFPAQLEKSFMAQIAEKGCLPCYRALWGMRHKQQVKGWGFSPDYAANYDLDFSRWPWILDRTNLKAVPIAGLGLGALTLQGKDPRAGTWLDMAVSSAKEWLKLISADGSYFEGLSYFDYSLRNLFLFFDAHARLKGDIDWFDLANFYGVTEFLVCMQLGQSLHPADGPDIVNFSDSHFSFHPSVASWIARHGRDPLAQFAAQNFSGRRRFSDFLWYRPDLPAAAPPARLKNKKFDLDWIVCRTGWQPNDNVVAFRSGLPSNHEHADRNTFIFKAYGERLLTDHFGAAYDWRDAGWLLRQTEAHNGVLVDGKGHQYHNGHEGTNPSQAKAQVLRYVDRGDQVWWCSDATPAYQLVLPDVQRIFRSLLFIKPDIVILFDQMIKKSQPSTFALRFHPDQRDGKARIELSENQQFRIIRPRAQLIGQSQSTAGLRLASAHLNLPPSKGRFPYVEIAADKQKHTEVVTVLLARPNSRAQAPAAISIRKQDLAWQIEINGQKVLLNLTADLPEWAVEG